MNVGLLLIIITLIIFILLLLFEYFKFSIIAELWYLCVWPGDLQTSKTVVHITREPFFCLLKQWIVMCWVTARLEMGTSMIVLSVALLAVCLRNSISDIALGLALTYSLQVQFALPLRAPGSRSISLTPN